MKKKIEIFENDNNMIVCSMNCKPNVGVPLMLKAAAKVLAGEKSCSIADIEPELVSLLAAIADGDTIK